MKNIINCIKLMLACLAMAGSMAACQSQNSPATEILNPSNVPLSTETMAATATINTEEIRAAISNALLAVYTKPNSMDVTTVLEDGQVRKNTIAFIPPDRKHIISDEAEYIVIGGKVYSKTKGNAKWEETQIPASSFMGTEVVSAKTIDGTIGEVKPIRQDVLDGKSVIIYNYSSTTKSGEIVLNSQTELWVGETDGLPAKMITDGEIFSVATDPKTGENTSQAVKALTTTVIVFDENISIELPSP